MRKIILSVLFVLLVSALCFPLDVNASNMFSDPVQGVINQQGVNIKNGPGVNEKTLCRISEKGTAVSVLDKQDGWYKVKAGPCEGWVQYGFVTLEKDVPAHAGKEVAAATSPEKAVEQGAAEASARFSSPKQGVLTRKEVDIRKGPDPEEKILCRVYVPSEFINKKSVTVLGRRGGWYQVKFGSCLGWVQAGYISLVTEQKTAVSAAAAEAKMQAAVEAEKKAAAEKAEQERRAALEKQREEQVRLEELKRQQEEEARRAALQRQKEAAAQQEALERRKAEAQRQAEIEGQVLYPAAKQGVLARKEADIRKGPATDEKVLCRIFVPSEFVGQKAVEVLGRKGEWYKVKFGTCQGWLQQEYITLKEEMPVPAKPVMAAAEPAQKPVAAAAAPEALEKTVAPRFAESSVLFLPSGTEADVDRRINLRTGPGAEAETACQIYIPAAYVKDTWVNVLDKKDDWYQVKLGSCQGWIEGEYLALSREAPAPERKAAPVVAEAEKEPAPRKQIAAAGAFVLFPEPREGTLNEKKVNLKEGPGVKEKTLCRLPEKGTSVKVLGRQGDWYKVEVQRCTGWVQAAYLDVEALSPAAEKAMIAAAAAEEKAEEKIVEPEAPVEKEVIEEEIIEHKEEAAKPEAVEVVEEKKVVEEKPVPKAVAKKEKPKGSAMINEIQFTGNTVIDSDTLKQLTESFTGRELTLDEMNAAADMITVTYQENGYVLAKAYLPEQDISTGVLTIAVLEGRMGKVTVEGNTYYSDRVLARYLRPQMKLGVAKESYLEKGLLLAKDVPYTDTALVLKRGEAPGTVDAVFDVKDRIALKLGFDYNNFGSASVSDSRYGTTAEITEPWWGSRLAFRGVVGNDFEDSALGNIDYYLPLNGYGTKIRVGYLRANYAVGAGLADLHLEGFSRIWNGEISHPLLKTRNTNLSMVLGYARKYTENEILGDVRSVDEENEVSGMLKFDSLDRYLGKTIATLEYYHGHVRPEDRAPLSRQNVQTINDRVKFNVARIQKVYGNMNLMVRASGQVSDDRLLPMDQVVIGGYGTARGHEPSLFLGDSGYTVSGEFMFAPPFIADKMIFGQRIAQMVQFAAFYDHSGVYLNNMLGTDERSEYLSGYGGGVRLFYKNIFSFRWDIGLPTKKLTGARDEIHYFQIFVNIF